MSVKLSEQFTDTPSQYAEEGTYLHELCELKFPYRSAPAEKVAERDLIWADLKAYLDNFVATSVIKDLDDAALEGHLRAVKAYGILVLRQLQELRNDYA